MSACRIAFVLIEKLLYIAEMPENYPDKRPEPSRAGRSVALIAKGIFMARDLITVGPKYFREAEYSTGLLEHSIVAPHLCYPDKKIGALVLKSAHAGQFISFDFDRPRHFPITSRDYDIQVREGSMLSVLPDTNQPASQKTPTFSMRNMPTDLMLSLDKRPLGELMDEGMLTKTTHEQAYEAAGAEEYIDGLRLRRVADTVVYQITPKGNSLINLTPDNGNSSPRRDEESAFEFAKVPGLLAH